MLTQETAASIRKAYELLERNAEALDDGGMTDQEWEDMLTDLHFAARQIAKTAPTQEIAA